MGCDYRYVFSPLKIGNVEIKNRIELAPAMPCLASPEGFVTRELVAYYKELARGGAGIVTIGDSAIDFEYAKSHEHKLNLGDDRVIAGLSVIAEAVHRYGAKLSIELNHGGRASKKAVLRDKDPIGPSPIPSGRDEQLARLPGGKRVRVVQMDQEMIDKVVENYAAAAERCLKAGLDMIMIHGAHGHLIAQFLSPYSNKRTDGYGGSLANRARFAIEVLTAIRRRVGKNLAIEYRISANELVPGGMGVEETIEFVRMIQDLIDLVHVSAGILSEPSTIPHMIQPTYFPHGYNVHYAEKFKKALDIPVTTVGSIMDLETADRIIAEGKADLVAMARAIIADPAIVNKARRGRVEAIRPCIRCHTCNDYTERALPIRCAINPIIGREIEYPRIPPADVKKKVVIVGGGPAGLEAALVASSRGHEVVLFEKEDRLGGNLVLAASFPFKTDMKRYLEWLISQTEKAPGVTIRLNCAVTPEKVAAEGADVVVVAVGADPIIPNVSGIDKPHVLWVGDVIRRGGQAVGDRVVIIGGGLTGCETALYLAQNGKKVVVADMLPEGELASDAPSLLRNALLQLLDKHGVRFATEVKLEQVTNSGAAFIDRNWGRRELPADTIVVATGFQPRSTTVRLFEDVAPEVYAIGDCRKPGNLKQAIHDGFNVAVEL